MTLDRPVHIRFIEYMPVGDALDADGQSTPCDEPGGWTQADHVPSDEVLKRITAEGAEAGFGELLPVLKEDAPGGWGPARYYRFEGAPGTVGVISPLSHHFCAECNRLRLTADGKLRMCLFSDDEMDLRTVLRNGGTDEDLRAVIQAALAAKPESHNDRIGTLRRMSQIGG
jgi:cyclic pyranopterin phosphate synthase